MVDPAGRVRRIEPHRNAVDVDGETVVARLKSDNSRTVALPAFVTAAMSTPICSTLTLTLSTKKPSQWRHASDL